MISTANTELQFLAQDAYDDTIDIMFDDYEYQMLANEELMAYSCFSYDSDCVSYGVM